MFHRLLSSKHLVYVHSIDGDGCLLNANYKFLRPIAFSSEELAAINERNAVIRSNAQLWDFIARQSKANHLVLMVGSNRQSEWIDFTNARNNGLCSIYPAMLTAANHVEEMQPNKRCVLDPYLLSDTYGEVEHGENFNHALRNDTDYDFKNWVFDESKISLVYAQVHKIAAENPDAKITYHFYDDRKDVLQGLKKFFEQNALLLPSNVTIKLHHYYGPKAPKPYGKPISGKGVIDTRFEETLLDMAKLVTNQRDVHRAEVAYQQWHFANALEHRINTIIMLRRARLQRDPNEAEQNRIEVEQADPDRQNLMSPAYELKRQIDIYERSSANNEEERNFVKALRDLMYHCDETLKVKNDSEEEPAVQDDINDQKLHALRVVGKTTQMLTDLNSNQYRTPKSKRVLLKAYKNNCRRHTKLGLFARAVGAVVIAGLAAVAAAAVGMGIGLATGAWSGPGAFVTGGAGLFAGASLGAAAGLTAGAAITGISAGAVSSYLFFKPGETQKRANCVYAAGSLASRQEDATKPKKLKIQSMRGSGDHEANRREEYETMDRLLLNRSI